MLIAKRTQLGQRRRLTEQIDRDHGLGAVGEFLLRTLLTSILEGVLVDIGKHRNAAIDKRRHSRR